MCSSRKSKHPRSCKRQKNKVCCTNLPIAFQSVMHHSIVVWNSILRISAGDAVMNTFLGNVMLFTDVLMHLSNQLVSPNNIGGIGEGGQERRNHMQWIESSDISVDTTSERLLMLLTDLFVVDDVVMKELKLEFDQTFSNNSESNQPKQPSTNNNDSTDLASSMSPNVSPPLESVQSRMLRSQSGVRCVCPFF